jgi:hypothetical protein
MSSNESFKAIQKTGLSLDKGKGALYNKYDTIACKEDFQQLFEVLKSVKDKNGASAKMKAVSLVMNPNFLKIKTDNFQNYYYELSTKKLRRYGKHGAFAL